MKLLDLLLILGAAAGAYCNCGCIKCNKDLHELSDPGSRVKVIYRDNPCSCPSSVPYTIQIPVQTGSSSSTGGGRLYEYKIQQRTVPKIDVCPLGRNYNLQVQVPTASKQPSTLSDLLASTDRVLLAGPPERPIPSYCQTPIIEPVGIPGWGGISHGHGDTYPHGHGYNHGHSHGYGRGHSHGHGHGHRDEDGGSYETYDNDYYAPYPRPRPRPHPHRPCGCLRYDQKMFFPVDLTDICETNRPLEIYRKIACAPTVLNNNFHDRKVSPLHGQKKDSGYLRIISITRPGIDQNQVKNIRVNNEIENANIESNQISHQNSVEVVDLKQHPSTMHIIQSSSSLVLVGENSNPNTFFHRVIRYFNTDSDALRIEDSVQSRSKRSINYQLLALKTNRKSKAKSKAFSKSKPKHWQFHPKSKQQSVFWPSHIPKYFKKGKLPKTIHKPKVKKHLISPNAKKLKLKKDNIKLKTTLRKTGKLIKDWLLTYNHLIPPKVQLPNYEEESYKQTKRLEFHKPSRSKRAIRVKDKSMLPFYEDSEGSHEIIRKPYKIHKRNRKSQTPKATDPYLEPFNLDHILHPTPIVHLLNTPIRYLNHVHKFKSHVGPVVGIIPKVIRVTKRYVLNFLKNFGKNAIRLGANFITDFLGLKKLRPLKKRLKRSLPVEAPEFKTLMQFLQMIMDQEVPNEDFKKLMKRDDQKGQQLDQTDKSGLNSNRGKRRAVLNEPQDKSLDEEIEHNLSTNRCKRDVHITPSEKISSKCSCGKNLNQNDECRRRKRDIFSVESSRCPCGKNLDEQLDCTSNLKRSKRDVEINPHERIASRCSCGKKLNHEDQQYSDLNRRKRDVLNTQNQKTSSSCSCGEGVGRSKRDTEDNLQKLASSKCSCGKSVDEHVASARSKRDIKVLNKFSCGQSLNDESVYAEIPRSRRDLQNLKDISVSSKCSGRKCLDVKIENELCMGRRKRNVASIKPQKLSRCSCGQTVHEINEHVSNPARRKRDIPVHTFVLDSQLDEEKRRRRREVANPISAVKVNESSSHIENSTQVQEKRVNSEDETKSAGFKEFLRTDDKPSEPDPKTDEFVRTYLEVEEELDRLLRRSDVKDSDEERLKLFENKTVDKSDIREKRKINEKESQHLPNIEDLPHQIFESDVQLQTIRDKINQLKIDIETLKSLDLSVDFQIYKKLLKLQTLKAEIAQSYIRSNLERNEGDKSLILEQLQKAQDFKDATLREIASKLYSCKPFLPRMLIKSLMHLQTFHCMVKSLTQRLAQGQLDLVKKSDIEALQKLNFVSGTNWDEVLNNLNRIKGYELKKRVQLLGVLEKVVLLNDYNMVEEEARVLWEINNVQKLQHESIFELNLKISQGLRIRRELKILFDLQKQMEYFEDKQDTLVQQFRETLIKHSYKQIRIN